MTDKNWSCNIDIELATQGLCRLQKFKYNVGDCLFDSIEYLLHFTKTSKELRNGTIDYFTMCLAKADPEALHTYNHELHPLLIKDLHSVDDHNTYLR